MHFISSLLMLSFGLLLLCTQGCLEGPRPPANTYKPSVPDNSLLDSVDELTQVYARYEREYWQKPNYIIQSIGSLSDKVIADIGAGRGYFTFRLAPLAKKVIAIDIDPEALEYIEQTSQELDSVIQAKIETRLSKPDNPLLQTGEADIVLMVNTLMYIENRQTYLQTLRNSVPSGGKIIIIDFKKRNLPVGPPTKLKLTLHEVETALTQAGWKQIRSDDTSLEFQYIVMGVAP